MFTDVATELAERVVKFLKAFCERRSANQGVVGAVVDDEGHLFLNQRDPVERLLPSLFHGRQIEFGRQDWDPQLDDGPAALTAYEIRRNND